nr:NADH dehydrogenase subunit 6 [Exechonella vieirai]
MMITFIMPLITENVTMTMLSLFCSTMLMSLLIAFATKPWFALILFLIYITGLLVLFGYFMAMSPNYQQFKKTHMMMTLLIVATSTMLIKKLKIIQSSPSNSTNYEWDPLTLFNNQMLPAYLMMTTLLLIALLMVVTLCYKPATPLRSYIKT